MMDSLRMKTGGTVYDRRWEVSEENVYICNDGNLNLKYILSGNLTDELRYSV